MYFCFKFAEKNFIMNYKEIAKESIGHLYKAHTSIRN